MFSLHASVICVDILKGSPRLRLHRGWSCAPSRWDRFSSWSARRLSFRRSRSSVGSSCGASGAIRSESITLLYTINTLFIVWVVGSNQEREHNSTLHYEQLQVALHTGCKLVGASWEASRNTIHISCNNYIMIYYPSYYAL